MEDLSKKTVKELIDLAQRKGLSGYSKLKKSELIQLLSAEGLPQKKPQPEKSERRAPASKVHSKGKDLRPIEEQEGNMAGSKKEAKPPRAASSAEAGERQVTRTLQVPPAPATRHVDELPEKYEDGRMVLLARDPMWLYTYWDLTAEQHRKVWAESRVMLRIVELRDGHFLREVKRISLTHGARSWYLQVDLPNRVYQAELGFVNAQGEFRSVLSSNPSTMPPSSMVDREEIVFATFQPGGEPPRPAAPPPEAKNVDKSQVVRYAAGHPEGAPSSAELQKGVISHRENQVEEFFPGISSAFGASQPPRRT